MQKTELDIYLDNLKFDQCFHSIKSLKSSEFESTDLVEYVPRDTAQQKCNATALIAGEKYIRKQISSSVSVSPVYKLLCDARVQGRAFFQLPRVFEYYEIPGYTVIILEYLPFANLAQYVQEHGAGEHVARLLFPSICNAVVELHTSFNSAVIHRDIKPSNIVVEDVKNEKMPSIALIDFGIARVFNDDAEYDTQFFGTRAYAPPEQFGFGQTDIRSDIYALGAVLYFILTGRNPEPAFAALEKKDALYSQVNPCLADVISKASAFDPTQRYQSVYELIKAFYEASDMPFDDKVNCATQQTIGSTSLKKKGEPFSGREVFGIFWDILVFLALLLLIGTSISLDLNPPENQQNIPFFLRSASYFGMIVIFIGAAAVLLDAKPLARRIKILEDYTLPRRFLIGLGGALAGLLIMVISIALAGA